MGSNQWKEFDCYTVLEIRPSSSPEEIRTAYRRVSRKTHPDVTGGTAEPQVRVNLAYEILSDPVLRQSHDFYWHRRTASRKSEEETKRSSGGTSASPTPAPIRSQTKKDSQKAKWASSIDSLFRRVSKCVDEERQKIRGQRAEKVKETASAFEKSYDDGISSRNWRFGLAVVLTVFALASTGKGAGLLWIAAAITWMAFASIARGIHLGSQIVSFNDSDWRSKINSLASDQVDSLAAKEEAKLERYIGYIASLNELINRASILDDSEDQVARRLAAGLFLMGYQPMSYDRQNRMLIFTDGDQRILVRFRHRSGMPTNISYVERMWQAMSTFGAQQGLLFCTPGLSENGAALAKQHGIKWYSLERMNEWISSLVQSEYGGPPGDILSHLEKLMMFLGQISTPLPYRAKWRGYR